MVYVTQAVAKRPVPCLAQLWDFLWAQIRSTHGLVAEFPLLSVSGITLHTLGYDMIVARFHESLM